MPTKTIIFGILLIIIGLAGYVYGTAAGAGSPTALIPAAFGVVLAVLGEFARRSEAARRHLMHAAVVVALLGFIMTAGRLLMRASETTLSVATLSQLAMSIVCLAYVILAVSSFAAARRNS